MKGAMRRLVWVLITLSLLLLLLAGAFSGFLNDWVTEFLSSVAGEIPLVGAWVDGIGAIPSMIREGELFQSSLSAAFRILLLAISENLLSSVFLGMFCYAATQFLTVILYRQREDTVRFLSAIPGSLVGMFFLWVFKAAGFSVVARAWILTALNIALLLIGIALIARWHGPIAFTEKRGMLWDFVVGVLNSAVAAGGVVGLFVSALMFGSLLRAGMSVGAFLVWFFVLLGFLAINALLGWVITRGLKR